MEELIVNCTTGQEVRRQLTPGEIAEIAKARAEVGEVVSSDKTAELEARIAKLEALLKEPPIGR